MLKKLFAGGLVVLGAAFVVPALAQPSVDLAVDVENVGLVSGCQSADGSDPTQTWQVALQVAVMNTAEDPARFAATGYFAKFNNPDGSGQTTYDVAVVDAGGFVAGEEVAAGATETFHPVVRATLPCDARGATMFASLDLEDRAKTFIDGAAFLEGGTPVPLGPTGVVGIALALGCIGLLTHRLGRRPKALPADVTTR